LCTPAESNDVMQDSNDDVMQESNDDSVMQEEYVMLSQFHALNAIRKIDINSTKRKHDELDVIEEEPEDYDDMSSEESDDENFSPTDFMDLSASVSSNKKTRTSSNSRSSSNSKSSSNVATPIHFQNVVPPPVPVFVEDLSQSQNQKKQLKDFIEINSKKIFNPSEIVVKETINLKMLIAVINQLKNKDFAPEHSSFKFLKQNITRQDYINKLELYKSKFQMVIHNATDLVYGVKYTTYKQKELSEGRFYSEGMSLQNLPKSIRHAISGCLYDLDIVNCKYYFIFFFIIFYFIFFLIFFFRSSFYILSTSSKERYSISNFKKIY
jgi:hypothetical protein